MRGLRLEVPPGELVHEEREDGVRVAGGGPKLHGRHQHLEGLQMHD